MPSNLEGLVPDDASARLLSHELEGLDHRTIARFRTGFLADACEDLFYQMVKRLQKAGELSKETVFIDGTKLEACANKYIFVWKKSVGKRDPVPNEPFDPGGRSIWGSEKQL